MLAEVQMVHLVEADPGAGEEHREKRLFGSPRAPDADPFPDQVRNAADRVPVDGGDQEGRGMDHVESEVLR